MAELAQFPLRVARIVIGVSPTPGAPLQGARAFVEEDFSFSTKRTRASKPNEATVKIHNLSDYTIRYLEQPNLSMQVLAGEQVAGQLFLGEIVTRGVETNWDIPEKTTTIKAADGRRVYRDQTYSASWRTGTLYATVVEDLIVTSRLRRGFISPLPAVAFTAPRHFAGSWNAVLAGVLLPLGFYYNITNGALNILGENGPPPPPSGQVSVPLISPRSGLIGSPKRTSKGVNFKALLDARLNPGWGVQVQSRFVNGLYRVETVEDAGSRDGMLWETRVQASVIK